MDGVELDTGVPHSARIYDYLLGGSDNFAADRAASAAITADWPHLAISMRANRRFMARVVGHLAAEHGLRQFLDIGSGLPTSPNLHEVVQAVAPGCRVVYVDNDPLVIAQGRAWLTAEDVVVTALFGGRELLDPGVVLVNHWHPDGETVPDEHVHMYGGVAVKS